LNLEYCNLNYLGKLPSKRTKETRWEYLRVAAAVNEFVGYTERYAKNYVCPKY
jgi:hypothetical protein